MRGLAFLAAVLLAGPALAAEPPAALAPYVEDGSLRAGDYGWARGAFDGADPQDKAAYQSIVAWRDACFEDAREELRAELAALGASLPDDDMLYGRSRLCSAASPPSSMHLPILPNWRPQARGSCHCLPATSPPRIRPQRWRWKMP